MAEEQAERLCSKCGEEQAENVLGPNCQARLAEQDRTYWEKHDLALRAPAKRGAQPEAYVVAL